MNTALVDRLNTSKSVQKVFTQSQSVVNEVPALQSLVARFVAKIAELSALLKQIEKDNKAYTDEKNRIAESCFVMGASLGSRLALYARSINNAVLEAAAVKTTSALRAGKADEVIARLHNLRDGLVENEKSLGEYKITPADIAAFVAQVALFEAKVFAPREMRDARAVENQRFSEGISELSDLLRIDLNDMMNGLKENYPEMHAAFMQSAKVVKTVTSQRKSSKNMAEKDGEPANNLLPKG